MTDTTIQTAIPCPAWCTVDHEGDPPGGFHAGPSLAGGRTLGRLWQEDREGAPAGIVVGGELLTDGQAHDLGLELVRAAGKLRDERMSR